MQIAGQYFVAGAESSKRVPGSDEPMFAVGVSLYYPYPLPVIHADPQTSGLIFLAGGVLQAITIIIVSIFVIVIKRRATRLLAVPNPTVQYPYIHELLNQVLITFGLFFIRLIVRIAEGAQGLFEWAATHEWVFGVFEFAVSVENLNGVKGSIDDQPIFLILVLWAVRPLFKFIFPLGHEHGQGAHVRDDIAVAETGHAGSATASSDIHPAKA